ncbi:MAG: sigma-70 family RNA polymerase sigma factor [Gemmataceae bacterium]
MSAELLSYLRRNFTPPTSDQELLKRYCATQEPSSFQTLVGRHGPMVLATCRRRLSHADADDAFQAVFLLLARKSHTIRRPESLAPWLHGTALRVCSKVSRSQARQAIREQRPQPPSVPMSPLDQISARELLKAIDDEVNRLPERDRCPLLLVYWQGRTQAEAAAALGMTRGALAGRLDRSRKQLRAGLARRGFDDNEIPALLVSPIGAGTLPSDLLASTLGLLAKDAAIPASVAALLSRASTAHIVMRALSLAFVCGFGIFVFAAGPPQDKPDAKPAIVLNSTSAPTHAKKLRVIVLDPEGKPLSGANVELGIWTDEKDFKYDRASDTDASGSVEVQLPVSFYTLRLWASKKPYVSMFAGWEKEELSKGGNFPSEFTFRLEKGVTAGGRVVDSDGKPIAGAKVNVRLSDSLKPSNNAGRTRYNGWVANGSDAATTDADGRWRIDNLPNQSQGKLSLLVTHPNFISDERWEESQRAAGVTMDMLLRESATQTLKSGIVVQGRVTDPEGRPIPKAIIVYGDQGYVPNSPRDFYTDADGRFTLPPLRPQDSKLTVIAPGWAPQLRPVVVQEGMPAQDFQMKPGKTLQLRVVDPDGKPRSGVGVRLTGWKGCDSLYNARYDQMKDTKIPNVTDNQGIWTWTWAPDEPVKLLVSWVGLSRRELEIAPGQPVQTVVLTSEHHVTGRVTDAVTGQPIDTFTVIPVDVFRKNWLSAERMNARAGKNGQLSFPPHRSDIPLRLRVEAPGYRTQTGPEFQLGGDTPRTQDFQLHASAPITGIVVDADGKPVANAEVMLATPTEKANLSDAMNNHKVMTDAAGRFSFPDPAEPFSLLAQAAAGFAFSGELPADQHDLGTLRLRSPVSISGRFSDGGRPVAGAEVFVTPIHIGNLDRPTIDTSLQSVTDAEGRFVFPRMPAVPVSVRIHLGPWEEPGYRSGPSVPLDVAPGQRAEVNMGIGGCTVTGRVKLDGAVPADLNCKYSLNYLVRRSVGINPPPEVAALGFDIRSGWRDVWQRTREGSAYLQCLQHWFVKLSPEGTFQISGVPVGEYDFAIAIYAKPSGCLVDPLARTQVRVTVTNADVQRGQLAVPDIAATVAPVPAVGDTPALTFQCADGTTGSLADHRGKYALVHAWASWCAPCKHQLPALRQLHERYAAKGLVVLSLSVDDDPATWQAAIEKQQLPWTQGRWPNANGRSVSSVPEYWLLDPAGKIIAKGSDPEELAKHVAEVLK